LKINDRRRQLCHRGSAKGAAAKDHTKERPTNERDIFSGFKCCKPWQQAIIRDGLESFRKKNESGSVSFGQKQTREEDENGEKTFVVF